MNGQASMYLAAAAKPQPGLSAEGAANTPPTSSFLGNGAGLVNLGSLSTGAPTTMDAVHSGFVPPAQTKSVEQMLGSGLSWGQPAAAPQHGGVRTAALFPLCLTHCIVEPCCGHKTGDDAATAYAWRHDAANARSAYTTPHPHTHTLLRCPL
jgi:hypothetical protein